MKEWIKHIKENPKDILPFIVVCLAVVLLCWLAVGCSRTDNNKNEIPVGHYDYNNHRYLVFDIKGQLKVFHDPDCKCWTLEEN